MTNRTANSRQPARVVLVLLHDISDVEMCHRLSVAMENFFSLICSMSGQCRLPFFGLIVLGAQPEALLPLQHVKGNFARIHSAISELKSASEEFRRWASTSSSCGDLSIIGHGIQEAITTFQRQAQSLLQAAGYWTQLEITLFTTLSAKIVVRSVDAAVRQLHVQNLKKVQVVQVTDNNHCWIPQDMNFDFSSQTSPSADGFDVNEVTEVLRIDLHPLSLQTFFMGWLHDSATDNEHLHIIFENGFQLRCDMHERLLNLQCIPFHQNFNLSQESLLSKSLMVAGGSRQDLVEGYIQKLEVIGRVSIETVCDSLLFGNPLVVRATTCWKIDWDELELNQQHFQALCYQLNQQNQALVAKLVPRNGIQAKPSAVSGHPYAASEACVSEPCGHFVLLPSPSCSLLLKPIGVCELLMPTDLPPLEKPTEETMAAASEALEKTRLLPGYNPLQMSSGLFESLRNQLIQSLPQKLSDSRTKNTVTRPAELKGSAGPSNTSAVRKRPAADNNIGNTFKLSTMQRQRHWPEFSFPTEL